MQQAYPSNDVTALRALGQFRQLRYVFLRPLRQFRYVPYVPCCVRCVGWKPRLISVIKMSHSG